MSESKYVVLHIHLAHNPGLKLENHGSQLD